MREGEESVTSEYRWDQKRLLLLENGRRMQAGGGSMNDAPSTIGIILAFLVVFVGCIVWATRGHPADADNEDLGVVAKDH
jgi:hypothetical protein